MHGILIDLVHLLASIFISFLDKEDANHDEGSADPGEVAREVVDTGHPAEELSNGWLKKESGGNDGWGEEGETDDISGVTEESS